MKSPVFALIIVAATACSGPKPTPVAAPASRAPATAASVPTDSRERTCGEVEGVEGTLSVNGTTVRVAHVAALMKPDAFDEEFGNLYVILSDIALDKAWVQAEQTTDPPTGEGQRAANVIAIRFSEQVRPVGSELYSPLPKNGGYVSRGGTGVANFIPRHFEAGRWIAGKLFLEPEDDGADNRWEYSVTFSAPIVPRPPEVTAPLDSPAALGALAFLHALETGDKEALGKTLTPSAASELDENEGSWALQAMKDVGSKFKVVKVVMHGTDEAEVKLRYESSRATIRTTRVNGRWLVAGKDKR